MAEAAIVAVQSGLGPSWIIPNLLCLRNARAFELASVPFGFVLVRVRVEFWPKCATKKRSRPPTSNSMDQFWQRPRGAGTKRLRSVNVNEKKIAQTTKLIRHECWSGQIWHRPWGAWIIIYYKVKINPVALFSLSSLHILYKASLVLLNSLQLGV
jgi:hypothetical protein